MWRRREFLTASGTAVLSAQVTESGYRVTVDAPVAATVRVIIPDRSPIALVKSDSGEWSGEIPWLTRPMRTLYWLEVDGKARLDAANPLLIDGGTPTGSGYWSGQNVLWSPRSLHEQWINDGIPRGQTVVTSYRCKGQIPHDRELVVHLPAVYERQRRSLFPVLYLLQHSGGEVSSDVYWRRDVATNVADSLIENKIVTPFVLVMPKVSLRGAYHPDNRPRSGDIKFDQEMRALRSTATMFREETIPAVEARFRVGRQRDLRAFAGVSWGGGTALYAEAESNGLARSVTAAVCYSERLNATWLSLFDERIKKGGSVPRFTVASGRLDKGLSSYAAAEEFVTLAHARKFQAELISHPRGHAAHPEFLFDAMERAFR